MVGSVIFWGGVKRLALVNATAVIGGNFYFSLNKAAVRKVRALLESVYCTPDVAL